jgi:hypothetical protein
MDASDFVERYWSLSVEADMPNAPFKASVSVNKYLIATQKNIDTIRANQWAVVSKVRQQGDTSIDDGVAARLRNGKGSPDDMELLLSAGVEAGALKPDQSALQRWADANLGVDCTGFVIAYLVELGVLQWNATLNGGASCPWIYQTIAKANWQHTKYADQPEIWKVGDMQTDDLILWMQSGGGPETKHPGHISVIYTVGSDGSLECAESSGADDGQGHTGPQTTTRLLNNIASGGGKRWWTHGPGVIVVRPSGA